MADPGVEHLAAKRLRRRNVGLDIADAERRELFGRLGLLDQRTRQVDAGDSGPAPSQLAGDASLTAGDVEQSLARDVSDQLEQSDVRPGRVRVGVLLRIEVGDRVVASDCPCLAGAAF
jgi:hypothetical protein